VPRSTSRLVLAAVLASALGGCREADPYYRYARATDDAGTVDGAAGTGPGDASGSEALVDDCPTCAVRVLYTCRSDDAANVAFVLDVTNESNAPLPLSQLTLRYWYVRENKAQTLDCDVAKLGCTNLVTSANVPPAPAPKFQDVLPPRPGANEYVEIAFSPGALSLDPGLDTGEIQLRVHNKDRTAIFQSDDYSFSCAQKGYAFPSPLITAYVDGVLAWGVEPPR
jgi:hypothetical protein